VAHGHPISRLGPSEGYEVTEDWNKVRADPSVCVIRLDRANELRTARRARKIINGARWPRPDLPRILAHSRWPRGTNLVEGINNKMKVIKRMAYDFRDGADFFLKIRAAPVRC
jgi:hypothetical protein